MIISRLATIEDPMLSYLLGMMVDRVAQLVTSKKETVPGHDISHLSEMLVTEPHGVSFVRQVDGTSKS